jgi:hypothetical protein
MLNLFNDDVAHPDRWLKFDRYPRAVVRRLVRGPRRIMGLERVFLNLVGGLDRIGIPYRVNDYRHVRRHAGAVRMGAADVRRSLARQVRT